MFGIKEIRVTDSDGLIKTVEYIRIPTEEPPGIVFHFTDGEYAAESTITQIIIDFK